MNGKNFLLGPNVCYLDFYLFETIQMVDFLTEGKVFDTYTNLE